MPRSQPCRAGRHRSFWANSTAPRPNPTTSLNSRYQSGLALELGLIRQQVAGDADDIRRSRVFSQTLMRITDRSSTLVSMRSERRSMPPT